MDTLTLRVSAVISTATRGTLVARVSSEVLATLALRLDPMLAARLTARIRAGGYAGYTGAYSATPKVTAQTLPTARRSLEQDITILSIPFYSVDNDNGQTIYIGSELEWQ